MTKTRIALAAALAAAGLGLTACGDETGAAEQATSSSAPASSSETGAPSESSDSGDDGAADADATPPGTELKIGEKAVLPYEYTSEKTGTIAVTVTAIEKGTKADLAEYGEKAKGVTPYFIKFTVENVGGTDLSYSSLRLRGQLDGGESTGVIITGGVDGKCESENASSDFTKKGATYETCTLAGSSSGELTSAIYEEAEAYEDNPVSWTK